MTWDEYVKASARTIPDDMPVETQWQIARLGAIGEAGEVCDIVKKHIGQGHDLDAGKVLEELGDVCWYVALAARLDGSRIRAMRSLSSSTTFELSILLAEYCFKVRNGAISRSAALAVVMAFAERLGSDLPHVLDANVAKLRKRYPDGFDSARSRERAKP